MHRTLTCILAAAMAVQHMPLAIAVDEAAGRKIVGRCAACHGQNGIGRMPYVPNLAGEGTIYLTKELDAFRSGRRDHPRCQSSRRG